MVGAGPGPRDVERRLCDHGVPTQGRVLEDVARLAGDWLGAADRVRAAAERLAGEAGRAVTVTSSADTESADAARILDLGILDAARALRDRRVSVPELVACSLDRIEATSDLVAYTAVYRDQALALAQAHQTLLDTGYDLGPLHGLPVAVKDNIDVAGMVTTAGSAILRGSVAAEDAAVVAALKRAGAIVVGKNNMYEFAWGGSGDNPHFGNTRNAWDKRRSPMGSSSGSATAVAARTVFAALGTDTGGSVRVPAAVSGVSGLRPTIGRVSSRGVFPLAWTLDAVGPIARSSRDCAIVLGAIAGHDRRDPQTSSTIVPTYLTQLERPLHGVRLGLLDGYCRANLQPAVRAAFDAALATLESLGAVTVEVTVPDLDAIVDVLRVINAAEASALHTRWIRERGDEYGAEVRAQLEAGLMFGAADYAQAQRYRTHVQARFAEEFARVEAIVTPTLHFTAPLVGQDTVEIDGRHSEVLHSPRFTALASVPGLPALTVPIGFDEDGLPIGIQVIAPAFEEGRALWIGHRLQTVTEYHVNKPCRTT